MRDAPTYIVAVVPGALVEKLRRSGWVYDERSNEYTATLRRRFETERAARRCADSVLPAGCVYSIEYAATS